MAPITADLPTVLGASFLPRRSGRRILTGTNKDTLPAMRRLLGIHQAQGNTPVIGSVLPFNRIAEAHAIAESFHKPGNLVLVMDS